jgi:hypothetical protein
MLAQEKRNRTVIHLQLYERTDYRCCSTFLMGQFATVTIVIDNQVNIVA